MGLQIVSRGCRQADGFGSEAEDTELLLEEAGLPASSQALIELKLASSCTSIADVALVEDQVLERVRTLVEFEWSLREGARIIIAGHDGQRHSANRLPAAKVKPPVRTFDTDVLRVGVADSRGRRGNNRRSNSGCARSVGGRNSGALLTSGTAGLLGTLVLATVNAALVDSRASRCVLEASGSVGSSCLLEADWDLDSTSGSGSEARCGVCPLRLGLRAPVSNLVRANTRGDGDFNWAES